MSLKRVNSFCLSLCLGALLLSFSCPVFSEQKFSITTPPSPLVFDGVTLYPTLAEKRVVLVDNLGNEIHSWSVETVRAKLLPSCNLLTISERELREFSWDGKLVWSAGAEGEIHHDFERLPNGNTLTLIKKNFRYLPRSKSAPEPSLERKVRSDIVREIDQSGKTVWEWHYDHGIDIYSCEAKPCPKGAESPVWIKKVRDWTHANTVRILPENHWFESGDKRFTPGNVITMARSLWSGYIIDRTSKSITWRYSGEGKHKLLYPHEAHMIEKGLPGAGNILIFNNRNGDIGSVAMEINPVTREVLWSYSRGKKFFSNGHGSLMRLPNGNTLLSEDFRDRVLEVTPAGEVVWQLAGPGGLRRASKYAKGYCPK